eukprot:93075-Lingulodinium_polyedra.AAC.1
MCCFICSFFHVGPSKEYFKQNEVQQREAQEWQEELKEYVQKKEAKQKKPGKASCLPKQLTVQNAQRFMPKSKGCQLFDSVSEKRVRAFYCLEGRRLSTSASYERWGVAEAT